jgi:hypothetical protein
MKKEITVSEFNNLPEMERLNIIWRHGFLIGKRTDGECEISLFKLFLFYVKLYYSLKNNLLKKIKAISTVLNIEAYNPLPLFKANATA